MVRLYTHARAQQVGLRSLMRAVLPLTTESQQQSWARAVFQKVFFTTIWDALLALTLLDAEHDLFVWPDVIPNNTGELESFGRLFAWALALEQP